MLFETGNTAISNTTPGTKMKFARRKRKASDFYFSSSPLSEYEEKIKLLATNSSSEISELPEGTDVIIGGIITDIKKSTTKKGDPMMYITLDDMEGAIKCIAFSKELKEYEHWQK
ncbi:hypothetical protein [Candidatus Kuenenia stuttgartiensis]|uniref:OB domain-containing protein n=1 Tax=Kuenenia stuttgartiensis TaxID=174633 RepID=A0A2C9CEB5_KUEST|nr:hypothetical protein [Candidatus Kuenenia stuttgartiensis]SOH04040.1 hypothetical protein KSMBR1_1541 [Candidatus Kuenenia stuttgartiensis]